MTIAEARAVNVLLNYLLKRRRGYCLQTSAKNLVREAAECLARKAYRVLCAGWTSETVIAAWESRRPRRRDS